MAIFRVEKTDDYTVMSNFHLRDKDLGLKAKGLLSLMLSLPDDWEYTEEGLSTLCSDGISGISSAVRELMNAGYIVRSRQRRANGTVAGMTYDVHEMPTTKAISPKREKPRQEKPRQENRGQQNTNQQNTDKQNTEKESVNTRAHASLDEVKAYARERKSAVDPERFYDYYNANGWKVGKQPMKDWRAAFRNWERMEKEYAKAGPEERPYAQEELRAMVNDPVREMLEGMR